MSPSSTKCQFNIYGDSFMTKICPLLQKKLKLGNKEKRIKFWCEILNPTISTYQICRDQVPSQQCIQDIKEQLTIAEAEIGHLHSTVARKYKRQKIKLGRNDAVLLMVGTYEIMNYKRKFGAKRYGQQMCRKLRSFVRFLSKFHKYIIIVTALPILKVQENRKYWELLRKYNSTIASMTVGTNVSMVNLFPVFLESLEPPRCNQRFYDRYNCPPRNVDVMWNYPGMRIALEHIRAADNRNPPCPLVHIIRGR